METQPTYTYEEAYNASLAYFGGDELAARVWVNKYAMKDSFGHIFEKSPVDMHWRIANEVARIEKKYKNPISAQQVFDLLDRFRYVIPAGSPMTGIGNNHQVASLSNCFSVSCVRKVVPSTTLPLLPPAWCLSWSVTATPPVRWRRTVAAAP